MPRNLSQSRVPHSDRADYIDSEEYAEANYLPPEVVRYLEMSHRRPYRMRGILAGALVALAGVWIILEARRRKTSVPPEDLHSAM